MISDIIRPNGKQQNEPIVNYDNAYVAEKCEARCNKYAQLCGVTLMTGIRKR